MDIKSRRIELNLTMKEVAEYVGVSEATISRWESGNIAEMKRSRIKALAEILHVSPLEVIGDDPSSEELTKDEIKLITAFRDMNAEGQEVAINLLNGLVAGGQYKKDNSTRMVEEEA